MHDDTCPNCGARIDLYAHVCDVCGADFSRQPLSAGDYITTQEPGISPGADQAPCRRPDGGTRVSYAAQDDTGRQREDTRTGRHADTRERARGQNAADAPPHPESPYALISTGGFIGILALMLLPGVNLILLIVWACGGCRKKAKQNFARAQLVVGAAAIFLSMFLFYLAVLAIETALGMTISEFVGLMNAFM